ncbi:hypothetical protein HDV57DRAFT_388363 [Trichoderma longibrachiatum]
MKEGRSRKEGRRRKRRRGREEEQEETRNPNTNGDKESTSQQARERERNKERRPGNNSRSEKRHTKKKKRPYLPLRPFRFETLTCYSPLCCPLLKGVNSPTIATCGYLFFFFHFFFFFDEGSESIWSSASGSAMLFPFSSAFPAVGFLDRRSIPFPIYGGWRWALALPMPAAAVCLAAMRREVAALPARLLLSSHNQATSCHTVGRFPISSRKRTL